MKVIRECPYTLVDALVKTEQTRYDMCKLILAQAHAEQEKAKELKRQQKQPQAAAKKRRAEERVKAKAISPYFYSNHNRRTTKRE